MTHTDLKPGVMAAAWQAWEREYGQQPPSADALEMALRAGIAVQNTRTPDASPSRTALGNALVDANVEIVRLETALRAAEAREQKLREALTFYADRHRWRSVTAPMCGCVGESSATNDSGGRARRALGGE